MRSTQCYKSTHKTLKRFVELYDQVLVEICFNEGKFNYTSIRTFSAIEGVLCNSKCHVVRVYIRNSCSLLCKEMSFKAMYIVIEVKPSNNDDLGALICYWLDEVAQKDIRYIVIRLINLRPCIVVA